MSDGDSGVPRCVMCGAETDHYGRALTADQPDVAGALDRAGDALEALLRERGVGTDVEPRGSG